MVTAIATGVGQGKDSSDAHKQRSHPTASHARLGSISNLRGYHATQCRPRPPAPTVFPGHTSTPCSPTVPQISAPESLLAPGVPKSPPTLHFLRQAQFSYSQEWENPCSHLFTAGAWGTPNWGSLCFLAQQPPLRRDRNHQPLANS